jgi:hypothetical protein
MPGKAASGEEDVEFLDREGYLEARLKGAFTLERFKRQTTYMVQSGKDRGFKRLLVDVISMTGFESVDTLDRYAMGEHAARVAGILISVAMLGLPKQFDAEGFGVRVAQNRGMNVRIFTDSKSALAWLTGPDAKPEG